MNRLVMHLRVSSTLLLVMTLLLGGVYPLVVTLFSQVLFTHRANGSLIERADKIMGSSLLGQQFDSNKYFWSRLSATTPPYNPSASGGSNLNPANPKVLEAANARIAALQKADPANRDPIPVDLITASASGLDPHISLDAADYQLPRVAGARNMKIEDVAVLITNATETPFFGLLGQPYVNVLKLNMALDEVVETRKRKSDNGNK